MDKTLGQIAFEACDQDFMKWSDAPDGYRHQWEKMAAAVAAAVKEEDARICDEHCENKANKASRIEDDEEERAFVDGVSCGAEDCAAAIRASIKEVK